MCVRECACVCACARVCACVPVSMSVCCVYSLVCPRSNHCKDERLTPLHLVLRETSFYIILLLLHKVQYQSVTCLYVRGQSLKQTCVHAQPRCGICGLAEKSRGQAKT